MRKGDDLAARLRRFAKNTLDLASGLPKDYAASHIARQLVRAATGPGASYEEARGAESRQDFVHKLRVADKELREAMYWIMLIGERWPDRTETAAQMAREADELISILTASVRTAQSRSNRAGTGQG